MASVEMTAEFSRKRAAIQYLSHHNISVPDYGFIFDWETSDMRYTIDYIITVYPFICYVVGAVYVLLIFLTRRLMNNRQAIHLRAFAFAWNVLLTYLNALSLFRTVTYAIHVVGQKGFFASVCTDREFIYEPVISTWLCLFPFMKILELGDTIILVLQKRTLHAYFWCHHILALLGSWYIYPTYPPVAVWLVMMINTCHLVVYLYGSAYFFNVTLFKTASLLILLFELLTMAIGTVISMFPLYYQSKGNNCNIPSTTNIIITTAHFINCYLCGLIIYKKLFLSRKKA